MGSATTERAVLIIATLGTNSEEVLFLYLIERIAGNDLDALVLDNGILGEPVGIVPDISASETALAGGSALDEARNKGSRGEAIEIMLKGAAEITARLCCNYCYGHHRSRPEIYPPETRRNDYMTIIFNSSGVGGQVMGDMIERGFFCGVVDLCINELTDHLAGAYHDAGPDRLKAALHTTRKVTAFYSTPLKINCERISPSSKPP